MKTAKLIVLSTCIVAFLIARTGTSAAKPLSGGTEPPVQLSEAEQGKAVSWFGFFRSYYAKDRTVSLSSYVEAMGKRSTGKDKRLMAIVCGPKGPHLGVLPIATMIAGGGHGINLHFCVTPSVFESYVKSPHLNEVLGIQGVVYKHHEVPGNAPPEGKETFENGLNFIWGGDFRAKMSDEVFIPLDVSAYLERLRINRGDKTIGSPWEKRMGDPASREALFKAMDRLMDEVYKGPKPADPKVKQYHQIYSNYVGRNVTDGKQPAELIVVSVLAEAEDGSGAPFVVEYVPDGKGWKFRGRQRVDGFITSYMSQYRQDYRISDDRHLKIAAEVNDGRATESRQIIEAGYALTRGVFSEKDDLAAAVKREYGDTASIADWNEIKAAYGASEADIVAFCQRSGIQPGLRAYLTRGGNRFWQDNRHYYLARVDHNPPGNFMSHDGIQNNFLVLGSWYGMKMPVLAKILKGGGS